MRFLILIAPLLLAADPCFASSIAIQNASFELPAIAPGTFSTVSAPPGWQGYGSLNFGNRTIGVLNPATTVLYGAAVPDGSNVGVVFLLDNPAQQMQFASLEAGLRQTLTSTLQTSTRYTLEVEVGNIAVDPTPPHNQFAFGGFPGYRVDLLAGGTVLASDTNTLLPSEGGFATSTVLFEVGASHPLAGQPLGIRLVNLNAAPGIEVNFDDVRLDATPISSWSDLGFAKAGVAGLPSLVGSGPLTVGQLNQLVLTQAAPASPAWIVASATALHAPLFGGVLVPAPDIVLYRPTNAFGSAVTSFALSPGVPAGASLYFQHWILDPAATDSLAASNAVRGTTPL
ncbi:MAG: hypothetical protein FJ299_15500 [Planctomycetes bacterium]|nr:hypothetical protein [Planctomycetota bacterium]